MIAMKKMMRRVTFILPYTTRWGEELSLRYATSTGIAGALALHSSDGRVWQGRLGVEENTVWLTYEYAVEENGTVVRREQHAFRRMQFPQGMQSLYVLDSWTEGGIALVFRHSAFTECIFGSKRGVLSQDVPWRSKCRLSLTALPAPAGWRWGVVGSCASLGHWQTEQAAWLQRVDTYEWSGEVDWADAVAGFEYKFVLMDEHDPRHAVWEEGDNRRVEPACISHAMSADGLLIQASSPRIRQTPWRGAGVVIPVFSLRSHGSWGVGDFGDLRMLLDWAASVGMTAVQVLPVHDTTRTGAWCDSYPYSSTSVFALHPIYLDARTWEHTPAFQKYATRAAALNALPELDYEAVFHLKMAFLDDLYKQEGRRVRATATFRQFVEEHLHWLRPYAAFCRRHQGSRSEAFHFFVQYLLHGQLSAAHDHARSKGIILKGDIPIGVSRDSVPVEQHPHLFHLDGQAGAPPDDFAREGQNWGFPTYNWEAMRIDGFQWWRQRLAHMSRYFDAYRIDHVLGFFRIWEIPEGQYWGTLGRFRPALPFSEEELRACGFTLPASFYARPRLSETRFAALQNKAGGHDLHAYFQREGGYYTLRPEASTQRDVWERTTDEALRRLLSEVIADVLFIPDAEKPGRYHPRVAAWQTQAYASLSSDQRSAFDSLYEDFFYHRHEAFWERGAREKLRAVVEGYAATNAGGTMLPCAEDLGMVPACVRGVLEELGLLSLEVQTMPKEYGASFADTAHYPYLSVATPSTHDMPPMRLWWLQNPERRRALWKQVTGREDAVPEGDLAAGDCRLLVSQQLSSPSMLCLLSLQDWLATDDTLRHPEPRQEQINVPADPHHYWRYRMHRNIEDLFSAANFNESLRTMIRQSGRTS